MKPDISHTIEAIIPSAQNPAEHLVHAETGELPAITYQPERHHTFEGALHALARLATGTSLGVAGRQTATADTIRYITKPVSTDTVINATYRWNS